MEQFLIRLAGHNVLVKSRFSESREFFADYIIPDGEAEIVSEVTDEVLSAAVTENPDISEKTAEFTELYRPIADGMPDLGGFVFHGAAITYGGKGYIFTAPSGTGKTTHIRLWRKYLGKSVGMINGDKPIITVENGEVYVHGTPWSGKERWQKNRSAVLGGICLLHRGVLSSVSPASVDESLRFMFTQTHIPKDPAGAGKAMELIDAVLKRVPVYSLYCDVSEDAVRCSFEALCGLEYESNKSEV